MKNHKMLGIASVLLAAGMIAPVILVLTLKEGREYIKKDWDDILRVTFVCPISSGDEYWKAAFQGMQDAAEEIGNIDVNMVGPEKIDSEWIGAFDTAIAARVQGIISTGTSEKVETKISEAARENIPVVLIDTDIPDSDRICYIGLDNFRLGSDGGEFIARQTGGKAQIAVISLGEQALNFIDRTKGLQSVVEQYPEIEIVVSQIAGNSLEAAKTAAQILEEYPQVDTFFCIDGTTPKGVAQKIKEMKLENEILCLGLSSDTEILERIEDGSLDATIDLQPYAMGYQAVKDLDAYHRGEQPEEIVIPDTILVTEENVQEFQRKKDTKM